MIQGVCGRAILQQQSSFTLLPYLLGQALALQQVAKEYGPRVQWINGRAAAATTSKVTKYQKGQPRSPHCFLADCPSRQRSWLSATVFLDTLHYEVPYENNLHGRTHLVASHNCLLMEQLYGLFIVWDHTWSTVIANSLQMVSVQIFFCENIIVCPVQLVLPSVLKMLSSRGNKLNSMHVWWGWMPFYFVIWM